MKFRFVIVIVVLIGMVGFLGACTSGGGGCGAGCGASCGGCSPDRNCCDGCRAGTGCTCPPGSRPGR